MKGEHKRPYLSRLKDLFGLSGRSAIVTGAARGIGKEIALLFSEMGASVAIVDINKEGARAVAKEIDPSGRYSISIRADVTKHTQVEAAVNDAWDHFGSLDILVNNAGICINEPLEKMSFANWQKVMDVNLTAVFHFSQTVAQRMIKRGKGGSIINIASMSGLIVNRPQPQAAYNTSKAGVVHLTKSCASEWARYGIRVNAISPGYTLTEMTCRPQMLPLHEGWRKDTPMGRLAEPAEIAAAALFLATNASSYITGHNLIVDGGFTIW